MKQRKLIYQTEVFGSLWS